MVSCCRKRTNQVSFVLVGAVLSGLCGCSDPQTRERPAVSSLVGTYSLRSQTVIGSKDISELRAAQGSTPPIHQIILRANGTYSVVGFPVWAERSAGDYYLQKFRTTTGTWSIDDNRDRDSTYYSINFHTAAEPSTSNSLLNDKVPYNVMFVVGDGDAGKQMYFEKVH